jgi:hypothetical protein
MYDVTIMCDSWMGSTGMNIMNFMVYCNGIMFFHESIDCMGHNQDADFVYEVSITLLKCLVVMYVKLLLTVCISFLDRKSTKLLSSLVQNILCRS